METSSSIGRCVGCGVTSRLEEGACQRCHALDDSQWVAKAKRVHQDPDFAQRLYERTAGDPERRAAFLRVFGMAVAGNVNALRHFHPRWFESGRDEQSMPPPPPVAEK